MAKLDRFLDRDYVLRVFDRALMSDTPSTPAIPQSDALAEARADSLDELLNRDPEGYSRQDRDRVVAGYRAYRAKLERAGLEKAAEAESKPKRKRAKPAAPAGDPPCET